MMTLLVWEKSFLFNVCTSGTSYWKIMYFENINWFSLAAHGIFSAVVSTAVLIQSVLCEKNETNVVCRMSVPFKCNFGPISGL